MSGNLGKSNSLVLPSFNAPVSIKYVQNLKENSAAQSQSVSSPQASSTSSSSSGKKSSNKK